MNVPKISAARSVAVAAARPRRYERAQRIKQKISAAAKTLAVATMTLGAIFLAAGPAAAADNSFAVQSWGCHGDQNLDVAQGNFVDYGPGAPGGGNNDDYLVAWDNCADGHGVRLYAWLDGKFLGSGYLGSGAGTNAIFDPFPGGNVTGGQRVGIEVCSLDGPGDTTPSNCAARTETVTDG